MGVGLEAACPLSDGSGFYRQTPARPSKEDLRLANDPGAIYAIVSLEGPDRPSIVAYAQDEKRTVRRLMVTHDA